MYQLEENVNSGIGGSKNVLNMEEQVPNILQAPFLGYFSPLLAISLCIAPLHLPKKPTTFGLSHHIAMLIFHFSFFFKKKMYCFLSFFQSPLSNKTISSSFYFLIVKMCFFTLQFWFKRSIKFEILDSRGKKGLDSVPRCNIEKHMMWYTKM